jgi:predicted Kef-type K+ transport protein
MTDLLGFLDEPDALAGVPRTVKPPAPVTGVHVGTVGERRLFDLTVLSIKSLGVGEYGESFLCSMRDALGNDVVWFTGENLALNEGDVVTARATVTKHDEFNGRRQTRVNRLKTERREEKP